MLRRFILMSLIVCVLEAGLGCDKSTTAPVLSTPADVIAAVQDARRRGDHEAKFDLMTPEATSEFVETVVTTMVGDSGPDVNSPEERKVLDQLTEKYQLPHLTAHTEAGANRATNQLMRQIADKKAFAKDYSRWTFGTTPATPAADSSTSMPPAELQNLQISPDGMSATAQLVLNGGGVTRMQPVRFRKINGAWLIDDVLMVY